MQYTAYMHLSYHNCLYTDALYRRGAECIYTLPTFISIYCSSITIPRIEVTGMSFSHKLYVQSLPPLPRQIGSKQRWSV